MCDLPFYIWFFFVSGVLCWIGIVLFGLIAWFAWIFTDKTEEQIFIPRIPRNRRIIRRA
jgi:hypothetical protein